MMKDFPKAKDNIREGNIVSTIQVEDGPPKMNGFYDLE